MFPNIGCNFPKKKAEERIIVCPCEVCKRRRMEGKMDRQNYAEPLKCNSVLNFVGFLAEIVAVVAFFIIATSMFWVFLGHFSIRAISKLYKSGRNIQLLVLGLVVLLLLSVVFTVSLDFKRKPAPTSSTAKSSRALQIICNTLYYLRKGCSRTANSLNTTNEAPCPESTNSTIPDCKAREIFKKSKLFAIPTEMKQPPALLVYLRDVILRNY